MEENQETGNVRSGGGFGMGGVDDEFLEIQMLWMSHGQAAALTTKHIERMMST